MIAVIFLRFELERNSRFLPSMYKHIGTYIVYIYTLGAHARTITNVCAHLDKGSRA